MIQNQITAVTLEDTDGQICSKDSDGLDSDHEGTSESGCEYDEEHGERVGKNVNGFEIHTGSNLSI